MLTFLCFVIKWDLVVRFEAYINWILGGDFFMFIVRIILFVLGMAFTLFGYFIYFQKKYNLINGFEMKYKLSRKDIEHAKKVGLGEFVIGIVLIVIGIILFFVN